MKKFEKLYESIMEKKSDYLKKVQKTVDDPAWQNFRKSLKGLSTQTKLTKLSQWTKKKKGSPKAKLQVSNYKGALKRGGLL